ncbi:rCG27808 [Rattus norvegicus]|uniref:RCG27808 n=1 Tax=Rattus norvegicus TaxID=10116 RepID=A6KBF6_RAT|nr:rCG27808 [Rattus norvegicus]
MLLPHYQKFYFFLSLHKSKWLDRR